MHTIIKYSVVGLMLAGILSLSSCGFGENEPAQQVVTNTATPVPTATPIPTPTTSPNMQKTTYTSSDKTMSITMPDATWTVKADEAKMKSFESPDQGNILIIHGMGEDDMDVTLIPDTLDLALSLERASDLTEGKDFEIINYTTEDVNGVGVYSYIVHYMSPKKANGALYAINQYYVSDSEFYSLVGTVREEEYLADIGKSMATFKVLGSSPLSKAATGMVEDLVEAQAVNGENNQDSQSTQDSQGAESNQGTQDYQEESSYTEPTYSGADSYTSEQLADIYSTRTIYRNSDGNPIVITPLDDGNWIDSFGNTYWFANDEDLYDQNDVDYYWHGEAGDVAFMPIE